MTNTKILNAFREALYSNAEEFSDEEIIGGIGFSATIDGLTIATGYSDNKLEEDATTEEVDRLIEEMVEDALKDNATAIANHHFYTAEDVIDIIVDDRDDMTNEEILDVLEDGQALEALGFTDYDQEAIEEAHAIIKERLAKENAICVYVLDDANEITPMTASDFIDEYAEECRTLFGVRKTHFWDEETGRIMYWSGGHKKQNDAYPLEYTASQAFEILFNFAKDDADRYGISYFNTYEEAKAIADELNGDN